ncbi:unnamed protein product [Didymodactylos carnosus]|uniref:Uncharacterized protein n=1 Tax=Didymodactylos carnosus TaxID=1234261 RepID=A0A813WN62_9BILA|nr:unnamed protein product [Didymodactylos carnosus]CAF1229225.1 unnamed protein product [Didymodactylos carnosus]CAF3643858.1 unnamed protein product [Didymodactylos carnosus]CAF4037185.1 unnamed protein product [Didymodactylos carnosus]
MKTMIWLIFVALCIRGMLASSGGGHLSSGTLGFTNEMSLQFSHHSALRGNYIDIIFKVDDWVLQEYRYYYYSIRLFGTTNSEYLPRQRLNESQNLLRLLRLEDGDYVICLTFVDNFETLFKPRYGCYDLTKGEKTIGSHHGSKTGYLVPLLVLVVFVLQVIIAVLHHIKAKNYAQKLLNRFIDTGSDNLHSKSIKDLTKHLDKNLVQVTRLPVSVQRRLSRVADVDSVQHSLGFVNEYEPPTHSTIMGNGYTRQTSKLSNNHRRLSSRCSLETVPEHVESVESMKHLFDSAPWLRRASKRSSFKGKSVIHPTGKF